MKNTKWALIGRIVISLAFFLMIVYGFMELVKSKFVIYDTVVLKLNFWTSNFAQTLWNILIIIAFFTFVITNIWGLKRRIFFWIIGSIYIIIGFLTFIFTIIDNTDNGERMAIGLVISLLLMIGAGFLLLVAYRMKNKEIVANNWKFWEKNKSASPA
jgi:hypothetical protein